MEARHSKKSGDYCHTRVILASQKSTNRDRKELNIAPLEWDTTGDTYWRTHRIIEILNEFN